MMYYGPREIIDKYGHKTGEYHYTVRFANEQSESWSLGGGPRVTISPVGYCAGKPPTTREEYEEAYPNNVPDDWSANTETAKEARRAIKINMKKAEVHGDKFHKDRHETENKAVQCYTDYCLDFCFATYNDSDIELFRYQGLSVDELSEPIEGEDVPHGVKGQLCEYPTCGQVVANETAMLVLVDEIKTFNLCSNHCNKSSMEDVWTAPSSIFTTN